MAAIRASVIYQGFVYSEHPSSMPSIEDAKSVFKLFSSKKELSRTRASHPLFARGFSDKLFLTVSTVGIALLEKADLRTYFDASASKIFLASAVSKSLLVFVRRSGFSSSFKCHMFVFSSPKELQSCQSALAQLISGQVHDLCFPFLPSSRELSLSLSRLPRAWCAPIPCSASTFFQMAPSLPQSRAPRPVQTWTATKTTQAARTLPSNVRREPC